MKKPSTSPMSIQLKRVYQPPAAGDGCRILVERLWPRGLSKEAASIDYWAKETAPSQELRRWFGHDPKRWPEFERRYFRELDANPVAVDQLVARVGNGPVTFVFAAKEERFNNAVALREYLRSRR